MTAIKLLEKLGADASFNPDLMSKEDKQVVEDIIQKAKTFNAVVLISVPDEEETEEDTEEDEKNA